MAFQELKSEEPIEIPMKELEQDLLISKYTVVLEGTCQGSNVPSVFQVYKQNEDGPREFFLEIKFQEGPIKEKGVNGFFNEDLIAMIIRRLEGFQQTEFRCKENAMAITKLEEALMWLNKRINRRELKCIEGTHEEYLSNVILSNVMKHCKVCNNYYDTHIQQGE